MCRGNSFYICILSFIVSFLSLILVSCGAAGAANDLNIKISPNSRIITVDVGAFSTYKFKEVCIDGVVYFISMSAELALSPKFNNTGKIVTCEK